MLHCIASLPHHMLYNIIQHNITECYRIMPSYASPVRSAPRPQSTNPETWEISTWADSHFRALTFPQMSGGSPQTFSTRDNVALDVTSRTTDLDRWGQCCPRTRDSLPRPFVQASLRRGRLSLGESSETVPGVRAIFLLRLSLLRFLDSNFPGYSLWTWEFHPLNIKIVLESNPRKSSEELTPFWINT